MPDQNCPNCGLINPENALRCDCGYDFASKTMQESYLSPEEQQKIKDQRDHELLALGRKGVKKGVTCPHFMYQPL